MQLTAHEESEPVAEPERASHPAVVVTGATGFIGSYLVDELLAHGYAVRGTGRRLEAGRRLESAGAEFRPVDVRDGEAMATACEGADVVVHAAATTDAWGEWEKFESVNVEGTERALEAARAAGVERFVYVSSPSVLFRFDEQEGLEASSAPPDSFASPYARSKWQGERRVEAADGLETVVVRPRAVYGPGDRTLLPRLLRVARRGVLPQIGDGETEIQLTYVRDVARALRRAIEAEEATGEIYHVAGDRAADIWSVVEDLLERLDVPGPAFEASRSTAMGAASAMEQLWGTLPLPGEPPLTRYKVGLLTYSQTYETASSKEELGWEPRVGVEEGVERVAEGWSEEPTPAPGVEPKQVEVGEDRSEPEESTVQLELFCGGVCEPSGSAFAPGLGPEFVDVPALFALIRHPERGVGLFDTGYSGRYREATESLSARPFRWLASPRLEFDHPACERLAERGVEPEGVDWIALSHFDPDHYGGLRDFPEADVVCSADAWEHVRNRSGVSALRARLLPGHLPDDLTGRLRLVHGFDGPGIGPFEASHDLFDDGSVRLVALPGHAVGQFGAFVRTERRGGLFLAADGVWTRRHLRDRPFDTRVHRHLAVDPERQEATYDKLWQLRHDYPDWTVVPSHCPEIARRFDVSPFNEKEER